MPHSITSICNAALGLLGKDPLVVDADSGAPQEYGHADAAVRAYEHRLGRTLRSHPWNFAMTRAALDADATAPSFGYAYRYPLPTVPPCARVWKLDPDRHGENPKFTVEGSWILTDEAAPLNIIYIGRITDPALFDDDFAEALAAEIASKIALGVLGSLEAAEAFRKSGEREMRDAKVDDSQENPSPEIDEGTWTRSRRTG